MYLYGWKVHMRLQQLPVMNTQTSRDDNYKAAKYVTIIDKFAGKKG